MRSTSGWRRSIARGVNLAEGRVLGRIHVQQVAREASLALDRRALLEDREARRVPEALGLFRDPDDVLALHDRPEADAARQVEPAHRRLLAQALPGGVGVAVAREGVGADDVEGAREGLHRRGA